MAAPHYERELEVVIRSESVTVENDFGLIFKGIGIFAFIAAFAVAPLYQSQVVTAVGMAIGFMAMVVSVGKEKTVQKTVTRKSRVRFSKDGIQIASETKIPIESVAYAEVHPRATGLPLIRVIDARHNVVFAAEIGTEAEGKAVLAALGQSEDAPKRSRYRLLSPLNVTVFRRLLMLLLGGVATYPMSLAAQALGIGGGTNAALIAACILVPILLMSKSSSINVGNDGVLVRWLGWRRFFRYDDIKSVDVDGRNIVLRLVNGKKVRLDVPLLAQKQDDGIGRAALAMRITNAHRAYLATDGRNLSPRIARNARPVAEWRADLERIRQGDGQYREMAMREEDLWRIVEDPHSPEDVRAGAALMLRNQATQAVTTEHAPRLRIAAEAVASPRLRVALEATANPDAADEAIDEALEELTREQQKQA